MEQHHVTRHDAVVGHEHDVAWNELTACNFLSLNNSNLVKSLNCNRAFKQGYFAHLANVCGDFVQVLTDAANRDNKDADGVRNVAVPKPQDHGEHLKQVKWIKHFIDQQSRNALFRHMNLAGSVHILELFDAFLW